MVAIADFAAGAMEYVLEKRGKKFIERREKKKKDKFLNFFIGTGVS